MNEYSYMEKQPLRPNMALALIGFCVLFGLMLACVRSLQSDETLFFSVSSQAEGPEGSQHSSPKSLYAFSTRAPGEPIRTPTPDDPHPLPAMRTQAEVYTVQAGDTLGNIARKYSIGIQQLVEANNISDPDLLEVGQVLEIPVAEPESAPSHFKIIPDAELVYGPPSAYFDIANFVEQQGGYLAAYTEEIEGQSLTGSQIIARVAGDFSVGPRILLAILEYQSNWVTNPAPPPQKIAAPMGLADPGRSGLYAQLSWAANTLNRGYYLWRVNGIGSWLLSDGKIVPIPPTINAGTAGVQGFFASLYEYPAWLKAVSSDGVFSVFESLFGYPFDYSFEPVVPNDLTQPVFQLPFETGKTWAFTGGPHGAWGDGTAWGALDFAPPSESAGCVQSDEWVVAIADGVVVRTGSGAVFQDLDETDGTPADGLEQTGWVILYMHIESRDRVQPGTRLKAGERIGHPSCEGGFSSGTHVHIARRYNGEWISADQGLPFILDGWVSSGNGVEYDGFLTRNSQLIEAFAGISPANGIQR